MDTKIKKKMNRSGEKDLGSVSGSVEKKKTTEKRSRIQPGKQVKQTDSEKPESTATPDLADADFVESMEGEERVNLPHREDAPETVLPDLSSARGAQTEKTRKKNPKSAGKSSESGANDSILNWYLNEIHKIPMLSREEEKEAAERASQGDERARNLLVRSNLRFVVTVARKYQSYGLSLMDLINEGNLGLIKAAERFNPDRGFHFISYAVWWIKQSILFAIQQKSHLIRLPLNRTADLRRMEEAERMIDNQEGMESNVQTLADVLDMKKDALNHLINISREHLSLDAPVQDGDDFTLGDNIEDHNLGKPDRSVEMDQLKLEIKESMDELTGRERKVLNMRFGLDGGPVMSLQKIGKTIGLSKERIRQIEKKAIRKIRTGKYNQQLNSYL